MESGAGLTTEARNFTNKSQYNLFYHSSRRTLRKDKYTLTTKGTKIHEKEEIHFTMKGMKVVKDSLGAPVVGPALCLSPLATNASPLDHVRLAAGGK